MLGKLRKLFGVSLSLTQLLRVTALRDLAAYLDKERSHADLSALAAAGGSSDVTLSADAPNIRLFAAADLPYQVRVTPNLAVTMGDGTILAGRAWMPQPRDGESNLRRPALIDILPYRTADGTVEVDSATYPYLAGHGFCCVRLDTRGTGDSTGHLDDEYSTQGLADLNAAVSWASEQSWCDGQVVLLGCSWGGIAALQAAAVPAPALKGVIAVCATEDRFNDDMHYMGGALLSTNLSWGAWMLHTVAQPPSLPAEGADAEEASAWEESWLERLEALQPPHTKWMRRSGEDDAYWSRNSLKKVPGGAPRVPVLAVGGAAAGGYANSLARLSAAGAAVRVAPVKTVLGPWTHQLPHLSPVGPQYGFLQEVVSWLGDTLGGGNKTAGPQMLAFATKAIHPDKQKAGETPPGVWLGLDDASHAAKLAPNRALALSPGRLSDSPSPQDSRQTTVEVPSGGMDGGGDAAAPVGAAGGAWFTFSGAEADLPGDQAADDKRCACFDSAPVEEETLVLGAPTVTLSVATATGGAVRGNLIARLCSVAPDGASARLSYGVLNLSAGQWGSAATVELTLNYTARVVPAGHFLRLALSREYWPIVMPQPGCAPVHVAVGGGVAAASVFHVPCVALQAVPVIAAATAGAEAVPMEVHMAAAEAVGTVRPGALTYTADLAGDASRHTTVRDEDRGCRSLDSRGGTKVEVSTRETYTLPAAAAAAEHATSWRSTLTAGALSAQLLVESKLVGHANRFEVETRLKAITAHSRVLFDRRWTETVHRNDI